MSANHFPLLTNTERVLPSAEFLSDYEASLPARVARRGRRALDTFATGASAIGNMLTHGLERSAKSVIALGTVAALAACGERATPSAPAPDELRTTTSVSASANPSETGEIGTPTSVEKPLERGEVTTDSIVMIDEYGGTTKGLEAYLQSLKIDQSTHPGHIDATRYLVEDVLFAKIINANTDPQLTSEHYLDDGYMGLPPVSDGEYQTEVISAAIDDLFVNPTDPNSGADQLKAFAQKWHDETVRTSHTTGSQSVYSFTQLGEIENYHEEGKGGYSVMTLGFLANSEGELASAYAFKPSFTLQPNGEWKLERFSLNKVPLPANR